MSITTLHCIADDKNVQLWCILILHAGMKNLPGRSLFRGRYIVPLITVRHLLVLGFVFATYRNFTWISFCYLLTPIFRGKFRTFFTNNSAPKKIQWTTNCPKNLHVKNEVVLWPQTSSKIIVLVAQPIFTDSGPPRLPQLSWSANNRGSEEICTYCLIWSERN